MRKIETLMNRAILNREDWKSANTRVEYEQGNRISRVYLYGNLIAEVGDTFIVLYDGGHKTNTTKSRINSILKKNGNGTEKVFQKNHKWFISYDGITEPFESGALLG